MIFRQLFDRESSTYTYLLADNDSRKAVLIDPVIDQIDLYTRILQELNLSLILAIDTHVHADHVTALGKLRELFGCESQLGKQSQVACASRFFADGDVLRVGSIELRVIYTPGHTDDSYSFFVDRPEGGMLFTGDTLLIRGSGRTDFQNGNAVDQYHSLFDKLLAFPNDTWVYPAHDYKGMMVSTIGEEKAWNPRLQVASAEEYKKLMDNLNLPTPKMMDVAVPANRVCGKS